MKDVIIKNLSKAFDEKIAESILQSYQDMTARFRKGDLDGCLSVAGKFVDHVLRAIEFIRSGKAPNEIKSASAVIKQLESDTSLNESLRLIIPRILYGMIYEVRSKRGAIHVKEIDPKYIDATLTVNAASWVLAEFIRLYHEDDEKVVAQAIASLMRSHMPMVEEFDGVLAVTAKVDCELEVLILVSRHEPNGITRSELGKLCKRDASTISKNLKRLIDLKYLHLTHTKKYRLTGPGDKYLSEVLSNLGLHLN